MNFWNIWILASYEELYRIFGYHEFEQIFSGFFTSGGNLVEYLFEFY